MTGTRLEGLSTVPALQFFPKPFSRISWFPLRILIFTEIILVCSLEATWKLSDHDGLSRQHD
jgi:hypothetical protein